MEPNRGVEPVVVSGAPDILKAPKPLSVELTGQEVAVDDLAQQIFARIEEEIPDDRELDGSPAPQRKEDDKADQVAGKLLQPNAQLQVKVEEDLVPAAAAQAPAAPAPAVPKNPAATIQAIEELAKNDNDTLSTQQVLSEILLKVRADGYQAEIVSKLKGSPKFEVETFSVDSAPGETFYKVGVSYEIKVQLGHGQEETLVIERDIYTTSKTPEGAISTANNFKETVVNLAKASSDPAYRGRFEAFAGLEDGKKKAVMGQRSFKFNYDYDKEGNPVSLRSIYASDKDKKEIDLEVKKDPEASKYVYYRDLKTQELRRVERDQPETFTGQAIYGSEEEALLKAPFVIKDDSPFDRLEKSSTVDQQIEAIKEGIKKKEAELAEIRAAFINEPRLKLLFSAEETTEFKQALANLAYERDEEVNEEELSPAMQNQIKLTEKLMEELPELDELKGKTDKPETDLKILEAALDRKRGRTKKTTKAEGETIKEVMNAMKDEYPDDPVLNLQKSAKFVDKLERCIELKKEELKHLGISRRQEKEKEIAALREEIKKAEDKTKVEKRDLNDQLAKFQNVSQALENDLVQLQKLKAGASAKLQDPQATKEAQQVARSVDKQITDKEISELEAAVEKNDDFIEDILEKLHPDQT